jgi:hypothetical protein
MSEINGAEKLAETPNPPSSSNDDERRSAGDGEGATAATPDASKTGTKRQLDAEASAEDGAVGGASGVTIQSDSVTGHLQCAICTDLLHEPVSIWPCLHPFCGGCLSKWALVHHRKTCPVYRRRFRTRNVAVNCNLRGLIDSLLAANPGLQARSAEALRELSRVNGFKTTNIARSSSLSQPSQGPTTGSGRGGSSSRDFRTYDPPPNRHNRTLPPLIEPMGRESPRIGDQIDEFLERVYMGRRGEGGVRAFTGGVQDALNPIFWQYIIRHDVD